MKEVYKYRWELIKEKISLLKTFQNGQIDSIALQVHQVPPLLTQAHHLTLQTRDQIQKERIQDQTQLVKKTIREEDKDQNLQEIQTLDLDLNQNKNHPALFHLNKK